jgi:hypothetical protein
MIEPVEFSNFKNSFTTDCYLLIPQWEELTSAINKVLRETLKLDHWNAGKIDDNFEINDELLIHYALVSINESVINFEKVACDLGFFMKIEIKRRSHKSNEVYNIDESSQDENSTAIARPLRKKQKLGPGGGERVLGRSLKVTSPSKNKKESAQRDLKSYFKQKSSPSKEQSTSARNSKSKQHKQIKEDPVLITGDDVVPDLMNDTKRQEIEAFIAQTNAEKLQKVERRKELKNYKVIDCKNLKDNEIREYVHDNLIHAPIAINTFPLFPDLYSQ